MTQIRNRRFSLRVGSLLLLLFAGFSLAPVGCTSDGLIGGECRDGYGFCHGACVSVTDDELNCGECDNACSRRLACVDGVCGGDDGNQTLGGAGGELGMGGDESGTGGINVGAGGPGGNESGGSSSGGNMGTGNSGNGTGGDGTGGAGGCFPPYDSQATCGDCDTECSGSRPNCAPDGDGSFECVADCLDAPFDTLCRGECVDTQTNARHCGACDSRCPSGICVDGDCVGQTSGHMVALCMNFESQASQQTRLLSNSVFLTARQPARVMGYARDTSSQLETGTDFALSQAGNFIGRSYSIDKVTDPDDVTDQLTRGNFDVLLVYDQDKAPAGELATIGADWKPTIDTFTATGGVVVVLTGGGGRDEMPDLIDAIGLFASTGTPDHVGSRYYVQAPGDAVGVNVVSPFVGVSQSCIFNIDDPESRDLVYVVTDTNPNSGVGDPGVVHRIVSP